jgi:electron transfer flavoprotein alpha/beta subunit
MKIIVCLKEVIDPALNLDFGLSNSVVFNAGLPRLLNPADAAALAMALNIKPAGGEIAVVSIGEERVESYLRNAIAVGADKAVRIWDNDFPEAYPSQKAMLLSGLASLVKADLVLTGSRSLDTANGQVGPMLAARLGWPCVCDVTAMENDTKQNSIVVTKGIGRGEREEVRCSLPAVVTVKGESKHPYAGLDELIESKTREISLLKPADLGISPEALEKATGCTARLTFPRPRTVKAPPLDSGLPAFYRILQLLQGGIAKRKGRMLEGDANQLAEQLFQIFLEEGVVKKRPY